MNGIVAAFPNRELHVILHNLNTHNKNERWRKKHPKSAFPFRPDPVVVAQSDQIETWFSILQVQSLNAGALGELGMAAAHIADERDERFIATSMCFRLRQDYLDAPMIRLRV